MSEPVEPSVLRALVLLPTFVVALLWWLQPPRGRELGAVLTAGAWIAIVIGAIHQPALAHGAWSYQAIGGIVLGIPLDVWIGWASLWLLPVLVWRDRIPVIAMVLAALWLDLLFVPRLYPLVALGPTWIPWDLFTIGLACVPAWWGVRWSRAGIHPGIRAALQSACYLAISLWMIPSIALGEGPWVVLASWSRPGLDLVLQLVLLWVGVFLASVHELVRAGGGPPIPMDPPIRLVTTGPYAYVRNPMQLSAALLWLIWGGILGSAPVALGAVITVGYGATFATVHESTHLPGRWPRWRAWADAVGAWWPRWSPHVPDEATLWVARGCDPCSELGDWIAARAPRGLRIRAAEDHPGALRRLRWEHPHAPAEEGIAALARAVEQIHLGWAVLGWIVRLPGLVQLLGLLVDASGGSARTLGRSLSPRGPGAPGAPSAAAALDAPAAPGASAEQGMALCGPVLRGSVQPPPSGTDPVPGQRLLRDPIHTEASLATPRFEVRNPATGARVETIEGHSDKVVAQRIEAAHRAWLGWRRTPLEVRTEVLCRAAGLLRERAEPLAERMAIEMGKPITEGRGEVHKCAWVCEHYAEHAARLLAPRALGSDAAQSYVAWRPLGVVLAVMPWNFPLWQVFRFAAPALAAGNGALLKHAPNVPGCALAIEALLVDAGLPPGVFQALLIDVGQVPGVISDRRVVAATLTGSTGAGRAVAEQAGRCLKPTVLELGGSDPYLILEDAELGSAAEACVTSRLINSGQSCIAAKRLVVVDAVYDPFVEAVVAQMQGQPLGDPLDEATRIGPLARPDLRDTLHRQVTQTVAAGARLALGGVCPPGPGSFYPPTVLVDVPEGSPGYTEETFGPVVSILRARDEAHAIELANDTVYGLGAAVFTRDVARGQRIAEEELQAGACFVNAFVRSDPRLPFGGIKDSGYGRELSELGIRAFVNAKTVYIA